MTTHRTVDIPSFVARHVYEFYFNCDYEGPTWTYNLSLDLKIIAAMPVLYVEPIRDTVRDERRHVLTVSSDTTRQEDIRNPVPDLQRVTARAA